MIKITIDKRNNTITFINNNIGFSQLGVAKEILDLIIDQQTEIEKLNEILEKNFYEKYPFIIENGIICEKNKEIEVLKEEVNKQTKIIKCYEKENRQSQKTIINLSKRIDTTNKAIDDLLFYDDIKDITNASFGNVKEELQFYLSQYDDIEEFRKHKGD